MSRKVTAVAKTTINAPGCRKNIFVRPFGMTSSEFIGGRIAKSSHLTSQRQSGHSKSIKEDRAIKQGILAGVWVTDMIPMVYYSFKGDVAF
jgi:hypothetical protein